MGSLILSFSETEKMQMESILMDDDAEEALRFFKEVIRPKIRAKGSTALDSRKSTGMGV